MSFERIVRPFQVGDVFNARRAPPQSPPAKPPADVVLSWAGSANAIWTEAPDPGFFGFKVVLQEDGAQRQFWPKRRIENPQDSSQFVEIQETKSVVMRDLSTGRLFHLNFIDPSRINESQSSSDGDQGGGGFNAGP